MKIELRHEALQLLHDQWGLLGEELREIWDGVQAVDEDLAQMFTGDMQSAYRAAAERSTAQASQLSDIFESLPAQLDEVNHTAEAFDRALGTMIQRGGRKA